MTTKPITLTHSVKKTSFVATVLLTGAIAVASSSYADEMQPGMGHSHDMKSSGMEAHAHKMVEVPPGKPVPTVNLVVHPDAMGGWNLEVKVTNFTFAPQLVNTKSTGVNQGHAHLYIDGKKVTRLYSPWYHLPSLPTGTHNVTVSLTTNDHGDIVDQGKLIQATQTIQVSGK